MERLAHLGQRRAQEEGQDDPEEDHQDDRRQVDPPIRRGNQRAETCHQGGEDIGRDLEERPGQKHPQEHPDRQEAQDSAEERSGDLVLARRREDAAEQGDNRERGEASLAGDRDTVRRQLEAEPEPGHQHDAGAAEEPELAPIERSRSGGGDIVGVIFVVHGRSPLSVYVSH